MFSEPLMRFVKFDLRFVIAKRNDLSRLRDFDFVKVLDTEASIGSESFEPLPEFVFGNGYLRRLLPIRCSFQYLP